MRHPPRTVFVSVSVFWHLLVPLLGFLLVLGSASSVVSDSSTLLNLYYPILLPTTHYRQTEIIDR